MLRHWILCLFVGICQLSHAHAAQPNIVIFLVDDMGVMDTSVPFLTDEQGKPKAYPLNQWYRTPQMEKLAARGIRFSQFCAMSVCSPTRVSLMTGQSAARHHTTNWIDPGGNNAGPKGPAWNWKGLDRNSITLPRLLKQQGYRTIHIGKGHFGPNNSIGADPKNIGFDVNIGGCSFGSPGSYYGKQHYGNLLQANGKKNPNAIPHLEAYYGSDTFLTDALTLEANKQVIAAHQAKVPFFLYFAHYAVHAPFQANPAYAKNYAKKGKSAQAQAYATLIESMDASLGKLLDQLEQLGIAEETLVIFLGDNGSDAPLGSAHEVACAAPLRGKKGAHYEGGMRVPCIAAWAAPSKNEIQARLPIVAGATQTQIASVCDVFPTILELSGKQAPAEHKVDGHSLRTLLQDKPDPSRPETFLMHYPHAPHRSDYWSSLRSGKWKVIYHYFPSAASENSHYQLYDLQSDPFESKNLATSHPEDLKRMMKSLVQELQQAKAQYPIDRKNQQAVEPIIP